MVYGVVCAPVCWRHRAEKDQGYNTGVVVGTVLAQWLCITRQSDAPSPTKPSAGRGDVMMMSYDDVKIMLYDYVMIVYDDVMMMLR